MLAYTSVGRPDHHSLLLLLAVVLIGLTARLAATPGIGGRRCSPAPSPALSIWISPEAMTFIGVSLAMLGLFWLLGTPAWRAPTATICSTAAATLGGGLLLERAPAELLALESDRLSIVHVTAVRADRGVLGDRRPSRARRQRSLLGRAERRRCAVMPNRLRRPPGRARRR